MGLFSPRKGALAIALLTCVASLSAAPALSGDQMLRSVALAAPGCVAKTPVIDVVIEGVRRESGSIVADLHGDNPKHFLKKGKKLKRIRAPAVAGAVRMCIPVDRPGTYAVAVYHDANGNRRFDKNWIGLPAEPYGISNNPGFTLGPPSFKESAFKVRETGVRLTIRLQH